MQIKVLDRPAEKVNVTWDGKTSERYNQWALIEIDGLPTSFTVTRNTEAELYRPGEYEIDPKSFGLQNGRLTLGRVILRPIVPAVSQRKQ